MAFTERSRHRLQDLHRVLHGQAPGGPLKRDADESQLGDRRRQYPAACGGFHRGNPRGDPVIRQRACFQNENTMRGGLRVLEFRKQVLLHPRVRAQWT